MISDYVFVLFTILLAVVFVGAGLIVSRLVAPNRPNKWKNSSYECGEDTIGDTWIPFNVAYYLFALIFLIFEVESAFLYPWAMVFKEFGIVGLIEIGVFVSILIIGLIYAWRKGALEWH